MGLQYRRSKSLGNSRRLNVSKRGLSVSQRVGPLTLNSRGRGSVRIAPGLSYRFGRSRKNDPTGAIIMLGVVLIMLAFYVLLAIAVFAIWVLRWGYFGTQALLERRPSRTERELTNENRPAD
jgi:Protein of unknown function (DUF4236)